MPFYKTGTVALANNSATVTAEGGANWTTAQVRPGDVFIAPGNTLHEILEVVSPTQLRLARPYVGGGGSGQPYSIMPSQAPIKDLYEAVNTLVNEYDVIADGIGQGVFPNGTAASPAFRFLEDQDTGIARTGDNEFALVTGGTARAKATAAGFQIPLLTGNGLNGLFNNVYLGGVYRDIDVVTSGAVGAYYGIGARAGNARTDAIQLYGQLNDANNGQFGLHLRRGGSMAEAFTIDNVGGVRFRAANYPTMEFLKNGIASWLIAPQDGDHSLRFRWNSAEKMFLGSSGRLGLGTIAPLSKLHVTEDNAAQMRVHSTQGGGDTGIAYVVPSKQWNVGINIGASGEGTFNFYDVTRGANVMTLDNAGNLLVGLAGVSSHPCHYIAKNVAEGAAILEIGQYGGASVAFYRAANSGSSSAASAVRVPSNTSTGRSINAAGTINANGADYAEYVRKADGCGAIAKGDVCGIDRDGRLTKVWADAVSYAVKSTDPNLVGGDTWGQSAGPKPEAPAPIDPMPAEPVAPELLDEPEPKRRPGESTEDFAFRKSQWDAAKADSEARQTTYEEIVAAYPDQLSEWEQANLSYEQAVAAYETALDEWETAFEAERQKVDRIAFCGIVPVNVSDQVLSECQAASTDGERAYLVAVANGGGIGVKVVRKSELTFEDHLDRIGTVWSVENGQVFMDVRRG